MSAARRHAPALVCALLATAAVFALDVHRPLDLGDESYVYLLSRVWARGEPLFARFQVLYPAGQYALFGGVLHLLGDHLAVLRLASSLLAGVAAGTLFAAVRSVGAPLPLAACLAAAAALCGAKPTTTFAAAPVVLAALWLSTHRPPGGRFVLAVSALAGLLAGFREDSAVLALAVALVAVALRRRPAELVTRVLPAAIGGFAPWLLAAAARGEAVAFAAHSLHRLGFLVERVALPTEVSRLPRIAVPHHPSHLGALATPVLAFLPLVLYTGLLLAELVRWRRGGRIEPRRLTAALTGLAYLPQFLWERPDFAHLRTHLPILFTVLVVAAVTAGPAVRRWTAAGLAAVAVAGVAGPLVQRHLVPPVPYPCCEGRRIGATLAGGVPGWAGLDHVPGETMISLPWSPGWYLLEGMEPGSRYLSTFPRHLDSPRRRTRMAADLARPSNRWVVELVPLRAGTPPEVTDALTTHYRQVDRWRGYRLWQRQPPPAASASDAASWSPP